MFTYFKKKQDQNKSSQQKPSPTFLPNLNNKPQQNTKNDLPTIMNSIKLPSNIFAQLLNQSTNGDGRVEGSEMREEDNKQRKMSQIEVNRREEWEDENQGQQKQERQKDEPNNKQEQVEHRQPQTDQVKDKQTETSQPQSTIQQQTSLSPTLPLPISSKSNHLSLLSEQQLIQLFTMFTDILTKQIQSQLIQQKLQKQQLHSNLLPCTLQTIQKLNSSFYQTFILETKQKYNHLVDQSTNLYLKSRQIANLVNQFVMSINLFFESQELAIPAQEIQKAIAELNPQKTQKYMNYLIKIFEANFDDVIEKRVRRMKEGLESEIRRLEKERRDMEQQVKRVSSILKQKQSTFIEQQNKFNQKELTITSLKRQINQLNIKLNNISSSSKSTHQDLNSQLSLLKRQLQRSKKQSQQLTTINRKQLKLLEKKQQLLKDKQQQIEKLGEVIKKVKEVENQGMESIVEEMEMKEKMFAEKVERFSLEKIQLESRIRGLVADKESLEDKFGDVAKDNSLLKEEIDKLKQQIVNLKDSQNKNKKKTNNNQQLQEQQQQQDLQTATNTSPQPNPKHNKNPPKNQSSQSQQSQQQTNPSNLINKQIFKHLFLSFDDQSKEWSVRNNIRNQIYIMLDVRKGQSQQKEVVGQKNVGDGDNGQVGGVKSSNKNGQNKKLSEGSLIGKWLGW